MLLRWAIRSNLVDAPPAPIFVRDVAGSADRLYLVEINCFNRAGFHASDVAKWVGDVARYVHG